MTWQNIKVLDNHKVPIITGKLYRAVNIGSLNTFAPGSIVRVDEVDAGSYGVSDHSARCTLIFGEVIAPVPIKVYRHSHPVKDQYITMGYELEAVDGYT